MLSRNVRTLVHGFAHDRRRKELTPSLPIDLSSHPLDSVIVRFGLDFVNNHIAFQVSVLETVRSKFFYELQASNDFKYGGQWSEPKLQISVVVRSHTSAGIPTHAAARTSTELWLVNVNEAGDMGICYGLCFGRCSENPMLICDVKEWSSSAQQLLEGAPKALGRLARHREKEV